VEGALVSALYSLPKIHNTRSCKNLDRLQHRCVLLSLLLALIITANSAAKATSITGNVNNMYSKKPTNQFKNPELERLRRRGAAICKAYVASLMGLDLASQMRSLTLSKSAARDIVTNAIPTAAGPMAKYAEL